MSARSAGGIGRAQSSDIVHFDVRHYTNDNGLPQNSVKDVAMDNEGFIWLTTESGLVRFDGQKFKVFDKNNLGTPTSRFFRFHRNMASPAAGLMAVLDQDNFVQLRKGNAYTDRHYRTTELTRIPLFNHGIRHTTLGSGLPNGAEKVLFPSQYVVPLATGPGRYYLCTSRQIQYYNGWKKQWTQPVSGLAFWDMFPMGSALFARDRMGRFCRVDPKGGAPDTDMRLLGDIVLNKSYQKSPDEARIFWNDGSGQVFFYAEQKLYSVEATRDGDLNTKLILSGFDFDAREIIRIFHDEVHQRIFLGSPSQGLFVLTRTLFSSLVMKSDAVSNSFYAQIPISNASLLLPDGYVAHVQENATSISKERTGLIERLNLYERNLMMARDSCIWGRFHSTVYRLSPGGKHIVDKWHLPGEVEVLHEHTDGKIIAANSNGELYMLDPELPAKPPERILKGLPWIRCLLRSADKLWAGTDKGVYLISPAERKATILAGTGNLIIRSLHLSGDNELWATTYENGFYLFKNNKLTRFPLDKAGMLAISHCMVEDRNGFFWISTNNGLFQAKKSDLLRYAQDSSHAPYYHFYSKESGFASNEFNGGCQPCAARLNNGFVSFPSIVGLVVFKPEEIRPELSLRPIFIDVVKVGGKELPFSLDTIELDASPPVLDIEVTSPYFSAPQNLAFEYALTGQRDMPRQWLPVNDGRRIQLSNLGSGDHTLHIRKTGGFDQAQPSLYTLILHVKKNWYETWYAKTVAILLAIFAFWLYGRLQSRRLEKRNMNLEVLIGKRTENLIQTLEALQESENQLTRQVQIQTRMIASLTHDIKSPLQAIITVSRGIGSLLAVGKINQVTELSNAITDSTVRVSNLLDNTLDYIKMQISERSHPLERFDLHSLVAQKTDLFEMAARKNQNRFINSVPLNLMVSGNSYLFGIIINNIIDNANKHTQGGLIKIACRYQDARLILTISDTGTGMPAAILTWLNSQVDSRMEYTSLENMHGVGLLLVKEFARVARSELRAENYEEGFRVHISMPGQWEHSGLKGEFEINNIHN